MSGDIKHVALINQKLNSLNKEIQKIQRDRGIRFDSRTTLNMKIYQQDIIVFRAVLINLLTRTEYLHEILNEQKNWLPTL